MPVSEEEYQSYVESVGSFAGVGTSSVHEDRSDIQPSFESDDIEHDTASIPGNLHIPHYSFGQRAPPPHRSR